MPAPSGPSPAIHWPRDTSAPKSTGQTKNRAAAARMERRPETITVLRRRLKKASHSGSSVFLNRL